MQSRPKLLIDATFINNSGGLVLLNMLVDALEARNIDTTYLFDTRNKSDYAHIPNERKFYRSKKLVERRKFYKQYGQKFDKVLCFANIPPPLKLPDAQVMTYVHQYFYVARNPVKRFDAPFMLKRLFLRRWLKNTNEIWVQTAHMEHLFKNRYGFVNIKQYPFYEAIGDAASQHSGQDVVYVSNGNPHKNHTILLEAWYVIAKKHPKSTLHLTVDEQAYPTLAEKISHTTNVMNHGLIQKSDVAGLLQKHAYVVYPSLAESLGLGLIEAAQHQCYVLAADENYTYSVIEPSMTFEAHSSINLAHQLDTLLTETNKYARAKLKLTNQLEDIVARLM